MAQADSVPSPIRAPITGATAKASTNRRRGDRRYFIGGSDARIIMGNDEAALMRLWREKRGEAEPEDLSSRTGWGLLLNGANSGNGSAFRNNCGIMGFCATAAKW
jgi:hypothetical protein